MTFSGGRTFGIPLEGGRLIETDFEARCDRIARQSELSKRESEVFKLLARGRSAGYIADALYISPSTVKTHCFRIYRKLDIHSQQELIDMVEKP